VSEAESETMSETLTTGAEGIKKLGQIRISLHASTKVLLDGVVKTSRGRRRFAGVAAVAAVRAAGSFGRKGGLPDGGRVVALDEGEAGIGVVIRDLEVAQTDGTMDGGAGIAKLDRMMLRKLFVGEKHRGVLSSGRHRSTINIARGVG
jgi:hypothetical protein